MEYIHKLINKVSFTLKAKSPTYIVDGIYLGCMHDALDEQKLASLNIRLVVSIMNGREIRRVCRKIASIPSITHVAFVAEDTIDTNILDKMLETLFVVDSFRRKHPDAGIIIHCKAGISRSASLMISYLMLRYNVPLVDAYKYVKSNRSIVEPNAGFMKQLSEIDRIRSTDSHTIYASILMYTKELDAASAIELARGNIQILQNV